MLDKRRNPPTNWAGVRSTKRTISCQSAWNSCQNARCSCQSARVWHRFLQTASFAKTMDTVGVIMCLQGPKSQWRCTPLMRPPQKFGGKRLGCPTTGKQTAWRRSHAQTATVPAQPPRACGGSFGLKSPTPASPLRDSPVHDEQEELDDIPMEQMNEKDPAPSRC